MALQKLTFCGSIAYLSSGESSPIVFSLLTVCLFLNSLVRSDDVFLFYLSNIFLFTE